MREIHKNGPNGAAARPDVAQLLAADGALGDSGFDLHQVWATVREGRLVILATLGVVLLARLAMILFSSMEFRAQGSLFLGDVQHATALEPTLDFLGGAARGGLATEIEILRSDSLLGRAIVESGQNLRVERQDRARVSMWKWLASGRDQRALSPEIVARGPGPRTAARTDTRVAVRVLDRSRYELRDGERVLATGTFGVPLSTPELELTLTPADPVQPPAPGASYWLHLLGPDDIEESVRRRLKVSVPRSSVVGAQVNVVALEFTDRSPAAAAALIDALMRVYLEQSLGWKTEEAAATGAFVSRQLEKMREALDESERKLADFKRKSGVVVLSDEAKAMVEQLAKYEEQRTAARLQVSALQQIRGVLGKPGAPLEAYLLGEAQDSVLTGLSGNLAQAQQELKRLTEQFTEDAAVVREHRALVERQQGMIAGYVQTRLRRANEQLGSIDKLIGQFEDKLKTLPGTELELATLTRSAEVFARLYTFLLEKQEQAELTKASTILKSRALDKPKIPRLEASPRLDFELLGAAGVGLLLGVTLVYVRRRLAHTFQSEGELRAFAGHLPVLAMIPRHPAKRGRGSAQEMLSGPAVLQADPRSPFAEAFRLLRTNLYYSGAPFGEKLILVTSPGPGDGKTMTSVSLAASLAIDGRRVLLVDADLRKPSHHVLLRHPQQPGLSNILIGDRDWRTVGHEIPVGSGRLVSITAGWSPPSPAELLSSPHLKRFLEEAAAEFEFVILDSPPFPMVADTLVLSALAHRVLSVLRVRNTRRGAASEHIHRLVGSAEHYSLVINDVALDDSYGYYYGDAYLSTAAPAAAPPNGEARGA